MRGQYDAIAMICDCFTPRFDDAAPTLEFRLCRQFRCFLLIMLSARLMITTPDEYENKWRQYHTLELSMPPLRR